MNTAPFADLRIGDGLAYHRWAQSIAAGDWLGQGVFYQAPLYPYFLAIVYRLFNDTTLTTRVIQAVLGSCSCLLLGVAGIRLYGERGVLAGLLLALYPPAMYLDSLIEKSSLVTLLTTALLALLCIPPVEMTSRRWIAAGAVLGLLALARENALILLVPILLWIALGPFSGPFRDRLRLALPLAAGCALILLPVGFRNLVRGGEFHLTTSQFGPNFYIGNHEGADGTYQPLVTGHGNVKNEREDATRLAEQEERRTLTPSEVSAYWTRRAIAFIVSHPMDWFKLTARKLAVTLNTAERADTESQYVYAEWSLLLRVLSPFNFGILFALAAAGAVFTAPSWRRLWFLYLILAVYALSTALFFIFARYRFPLVPVLMILATGGLLAACDSWRSQNRKRLLPALLAAALAFGFAHLPVVDISVDRAVNYFAIAAALSGDPQRFEAAADFFKRTLAEDPQWPPPHYGLGRLLMTAGLNQEAIPHFRAALAVWPDYSEVHYYLALALQATGHAAEAAAEYGEFQRTQTPSSP